MNKDIKTVLVRVNEHDSEEITIDVWNTPENNGENDTKANESAPPSETISGESLLNVSWKPRRNRDSIQYRDTGKWLELVEGEWAAVALDEILAGMTLEEFKTATEQAPTERVRVFL